MPGQLAAIVASAESEIRNTPLERICERASLEDLLAECDDLENFRHRSRNLYERVRALFFLYAIHRFHLPAKPGLNQRGFIPFEGYEHLLKRRFEEAIGVFSAAQRANGPNDAVSSALAAAYHGLAFQTLAD